MAMNILDKEHPEVMEAVADAIRYTIEKKPQDNNPLSLVADHVLASSDKYYETHQLSTNSTASLSSINTNNNNSSSSSSSSSSLNMGNSSPTERITNEADEVNIRARVGRGRRGVIFSESVTVDKDWVPIIIPKTDNERNEIRHVIDQNILLNGIDEEGRKIIADAMSRKTFQPQEIIIKQNDLGDYYYIISSGTADIFVNNKLVLQIGKGSGFGELALLYDAPRAATVMATSLVQTWAIDRETFKKVIIGTTQRKRQLYASFLSSVPILSTLRQEEISTMTDALQPVMFRAGEIVVQEGDTDANRFYIVEEGELKGTMKEMGSTEVCPRIVRGSYFGERALLMDVPRAATITAVTDSRCLAMDRAAFVRLMGPLNELLERNMEIYNKYMN